MKYQETAILFKALSDDNRIQILEILCEGEKCACVILEKLHISQSTLSHHMKILSECGVVLSRKEGKWIHYSANKKTIEKMMKFLNEVM